MPTKRKRRESPRRYGYYDLTPEREEWLTRGCLLINGHKFEDFFESMDHCKQLWQKYRDKLMRCEFEFCWFGQPEKREAGWRSWGWWTFEAPEPKKKVMVRFPEDPIHDYVYPEHIQGPRWREEDEEDLDYLKRLGLLEPWEKTELGITD
jgi:hypothetical protein